MRYKDEQYVLDTLDDIRKETHENNIMLQHICSYIDHVLSTRKNDEQNAFVYKLRYFEFFNYK